MKPTAEIIAPSFSKSSASFASPTRSTPPSDNAIMAGYNFFSRKQGTSTCLAPERDRDYVAIPREQSTPSDVEKKISLGNAIYQLDNTYIIAENGDNLIIVDQHAAAERITLEKLKNNLSLDSQTLLLPEVCPLKESQIEQLDANSDIMLKFGIHYQRLGPDCISISALPAILETCDAKSLINDVADELSAFGNIRSMDQKIHHILSTISCHGSLRAGRKLSIQEMNSLLRQMENTENIAQCCHGRPSYIIFSTQNLNKFFERS
jgi:DNA mismatch repair protein MutL